MLFLPYFMMLLCPVYGYTLTDVERLKQHLFANYNKDIRPIINQSRPIEVTVSFRLRSLIQFDMSNGQLDTMGYIITNWKDEKMAWFATEFNDIPRISLNGDDLWHPHVAQLNAMGDEVQLDTITLLMDGTAVRGEIRKYYTFCELNMSFYPMDKHDCKFEFVSYKYLSQDVKLLPDINGVDTSHLIRHGEWMITDTSATHYDIEFNGDELTSQPLTYNLVLERRPSFNLIHKALPLLILAASTVVIHGVPFNSGERISYAVTLLLAFVFWQAIVTEELPKNSSSISVFSMLVTVVLCNSGIITIMSVILCRIASFDADRPIPATLQRLALKRRRKRKNRIAYQREVSHVSVSYGDQTNGQEDGEPVKKFNRSTSSHNEEFVVNPNNVSWMEAAHAIDIVLFYIHATVTALCGVAFIVIYSLQATSVL